MTAAAAGTPYTIAPARGRDELDTAARLFREYQAAIGIDLSFQGFDDELRTLPGAYAPPRGEILVARAGRAAVGIVALRPLAGDETACEMKRLYVRENFRAAKLGRRLAEAIIGHARHLGYRRMVLDTLDTMSRAAALYRALGFDTIAPYYDNPLPGTLYFERVL